MDQLNNPVVALTLSPLAASLLYWNQVTAAKNKTTPSSATMSDSWKGMTAALDHYVIPVGVGYAAGYVSIRFFGINSLLVASGIAGGAAYLYGWSGGEADVDKELKKVF